MQKPFSPIQQNAVPRLPICLPFKGRKVVKLSANFRVTSI